MFILSDSPPEKDVQWSEQGIASAHKFIQKLWKLNLLFLEQIKKDISKDRDDEINKFTNRFIKKINFDLENFHYNVIIASLHQMCTHLLKEINKGYKKDTLVLNYKKILTVINPILPHFSNECLQMIGENQNINWPSYDERYLEEKTVTIVLQINGKNEDYLMQEKIWKKVKFLIKLKMT